MSLINPINFNAVAFIKFAGLGVVALLADDVRSTTINNRFKCLIRVVTLVHLMVEAHSFYILSFSLFSLVSPLDVQKRYVVQFQSLSKKK